MDENTVKDMLGKDLINFQKPHMYSVIRLKPNETHYQSLSRFMMVAVPYPPVETKDYWRY